MSTVIIASNESCHSSSATLAQVLLKLISPDHILYVIQHPGLVFVLESSSLQVKIPSERIVLALSLPLIHVSSHLSLQVLQLCSHFLILSLSSSQLVFQLLLLILHISVLNLGASLSFLQLNVLSLKLQQLSADLLKLGVKLVQVLFMGSPEEIQLCLNGEQL